MSRKAKAPSAKAIQRENKKLEKAAVSKQREEVVAAHKLAIANARSTSVDAGFVLYAACYKANIALKKGERERVLEELDFSSSKFSMFAKIGSNEYLRKDEVRPYLPEQEYSVLYQAALWDSAKVDRAIAAKVLHRGCERDDLIAFEQPPTSSAEVGQGAEGLTSDDRHWTFGIIKFYNDLSPDQQADLEDELKLTVSKYSGKVARPPDAIAAASTSYLKELAQFLWPEARRVTLNYVTEKRHHLREAVNKKDKSLDQIRTKMGKCYLGSKFNDALRDALEYVPLPPVLQSVRDQEARVAKRFKQMRDEPEGELERVRNVAAAVNAEIQEAELSGDNPVE